jgi:PAS domain S-box-containing protein
MLPIMAADFLQQLRRGVDNGEIIPYFQPLVELRTGQLSGFEVLARWRHPERGMIPPDQFIWLAEESGLIGKMTENLLAQAFAAAAVLPDHLSLAVNISAIQLRNRLLPEQISAAAARASFPTSRLTVEITESALMSNSEQARQITDELKDTGVRLALDDFGTGYASLRYLHALTFDQIKVDRTFVQSIVSRRESRKIVAAILGLGQSLGMVTVAEGVEEPEQAEMLVRLGCDMGQGWLYGQPARQQELMRIVEERQAKVGKQESPPPSFSSPSLHMDSLPAQRLSQLQAIYDSAPVGLCFLDTNLRYVSLNRRLAEIHDLPIITHLGLTVKELLPKTYSVIEPYLLRALNGETITGLEIENIESPLKRRMLVSYQPARDEAGEVVGVALSVLDVTERARTQAALRESEEHYRNRVELSPQVSWTAAPDGKILDVSPLWMALTGLTMEQTLGDGWISAVHTDDLAHTTEQWNVSLVTGDPVDIQYRIHCVDGSYRWMRARAQPRRGPDGSIIRWYGMLDDIDEHMRTLEELEQSRARLRAESRLGSNC